MNTRLIIVLLTILCIETNIYAQDTLTTRKKIDSAVVFDKKEGRYIYYRDYNDPDFKQIKSKKRNYRKVKLANGEVIWFSMSDKYTRFRMGFELGGGHPVGDFRSDDDSRQNAGYAKTGGGLEFFLTKRIYKFVDLQLRFWGHYASNENYNDSSIYQNINSWNNLGAGIGPTFTFKLSSRFYAEIPVLFTFSHMEKYTENSVNDNSSGFAYEYFDGSGWGSGFTTGLTLNMRIGQHFAVGLGSNLHHGQYQMDYYHNGYGVASYNDQNYSLVNKWSYLTSNIRAVIHF